MTRFSANLGFLWTELALPDAIRSAGKAGFDAVECHWPYEVPAEQTLAALQDTGLSMLGLNTRRGDLTKGDNGVAAIPGRDTEARQYIDEAITYARMVSCKNVHVMAGFSARDEASEHCFVTNLQYACESAATEGISILIEPLNHFDAPGYHLSTLDAALGTLQSVGADNLKIMFDCYHLQIMQGDLGRRLKHHLQHIGHIQIAAVPDRTEPDAGEIHYPNLLKTIDELGWDGFIGAEYKPRTTTDAGLGWLDAYR